MALGHIFREYSGFEREGARVDGVGVCEGYEQISWDLGR